MKKDSTQNKTDSFSNALEGKVYSLLVQNGWNVAHEMNHRDLSFSMRSDTERKVFRPDFTLLDQNHGVIGFVEVLCNTNSLPWKAHMLQDLLHAYKPPISMVTNGFVYDIYIKGEHFSQTHFCPNVRILDALRKEADSNG